VEKALLNQVATSSLFIDGITPQILRDAAIQLEVEEKKALPGSTVVIKLSNGVTLVYHPSISISKFLSRNGSGIDLTNEIPHSSLAAKNATA
jgi:hypothetical protein